MKNRKAAGLDGIRPDIRKTRKLDNVLLRLCNVVYNQNTIDKWTKRCRCHFPKKGDLGLAKNYRSITVISTASWIYNALLNNRIAAKIEKIFWKNQNDFRRNRSMPSSNSRRSTYKQLQATILFVVFSKTFDSICRGKMEQILLSYGLPKDTVATILMLYKKSESKSPLPGWRRILLRHRSRCAARSHISSIHLYHLSRLRVRTSTTKMKDNSFKLTKERSSRYFAQKLRTWTTTMT